jgi:hypothetical protein
MHRPVRTNHRLPRWSSLLARKQNRGGRSHPENDSANAVLQNLNVLSLPALGAFLDIELNRLAFLEAAESLCLNGGVVDEYVLTVLAADKTETLGVVEPLYCSLFHFRDALFCVELCGEVKSGLRQEVLQQSFGSNVLRSIQIHQLLQYI